MYTESFKNTEVIDFFSALVDLEIELQKENIFQLIQMFW